MKAYAYRIQQVGPRSISELTQRLYDLELDGRAFGGDASLRLEERVVDGDFLYLDFAKRRGGHGPAKYAAARPLAAFEMADDEGFGEDTALICHVPTNTVAAQYNHHGPKVVRIQDHLFAADLRFGIGPAVAGVLDADRCGLRFGAILTQNAIQKLRGIGFFRQIDFAIAVPGIQPGDMAAGRGLGDALRAPLPGGVETIRMSIGATTKKDSRLDGGAAAGFVTQLLGMGAALQQASVKGKRGIDDPVEEVDLVEDRVKRDVDVAMGAGNRYPTANRWAALRGAWDAWHRAGLLQL